MRDSAPTQTIAISLPGPDATGHDQDEEWCEVTIDGNRRRIRFHDYDEIFAIPGLYERLFYEELRCSSPRVVREMLEAHLESSGDDPEPPRVLDVGAGNGIVAEELEKLGAETLVGIDILEEAKEAAERDRPGLYDEYHVADLTALPDEVDAALEDVRFNCMTTVAALGYADMPPAAFAGAFSYLEEGGLLGISIKSEFVGDEDDPSGFSRMVGAAVEDGTLEEVEKRRFVHRLSAAGEPIHYTAMVAVKRGELPEVVAA
ncbi:MAG TPA: methyltransferase domain-containing protein [Solirubrobacterales bacterium]|nr:methyltransferase domain-containing protein [Solirubrobacterales bacterium]